MADSLADVVGGVVLAAGSGTRLRPLSELRPKPLCPMGDSTLLDRALGQVSLATGATVATNVHHGRAAVLEHLERRPGDHGGVHVSVEEPEALGTAGAVAALAEWLDGRAALVLNADTVHDEDLGAFLDGWDGCSVRVMMTGEPPFGPRSGVVASIVPAADVVRLRVEPSGLWEVLWRPAIDAGRLDAVVASGPVIDCGTPWDYLRANLWLSGGSSVIGAGAEVRGEVVRSVVWPSAEVDEAEVLVDAVRADRRCTVLCRPG